MKESRSWRRRCAPVAAVILLLSAATIPARAEQDMAFPGRVEISSDAQDALRILGGIVTGQTSVSSAFAGVEAVLIDQHDPTMVAVVGPNPGNVGGTKFGTTYLAAQFGNGPTAESIYTNDTWHIGMNVGNQWGGVGRTDTSRPNLALSFESKFFAGNVFGQEFHLQGVTSDGVTTFRPLTFFVAHDASVIGGTLEVDTFALHNKTGRNMLLVNDTNNAMDLVDGLKLRFASANVPAIQQMNGARTGFVNLLRLTSGDVASVEAPLYVVGNRAGGSAPIPGAFATFQPTSANNGDIALLAQLPNVTGNVYGVLASGTVGGILQNAVINHATTPNAHARELLLVSGDSGGDPYITFTVSGQRDVSMGIDNSNSDKFVISNGSTLGYNNLLSIDPTSANVNMTSLSIGSNAASNGDLRLRYGTVLAARNESNTQDINVLSFGLAGLNAVRVGAAGANTRLASDLAAPGNAVNGDWWVECTNGGVAPATCSINVHAGGAMRTIASVSY
jgi:hypothetical protein